MKTREWIQKELRYLACRDRRDLPLPLVDLKFDEKAGPDDPVKFQGYGSVWGRIDSYGDTILKGAFVDSLKDRRPMMLFGHSPGRVPGKWLSYEEDDKGLLMKGELTPGHSEAKDIAASLKHGALNGLSIGGYTVDYEPQKSGGRLIGKFDLYEVSIVSMPAEQEARIDTTSVKQMIDECSSLSEFESLLRDAAGVSKSAATAIVARFVRIARGEPVEVSQAKQANEFLELIKQTKLPTLETPS